MKPKIKLPVTLIIVLIVLSAGIGFAQTVDTGTAKVPGDLQDLLEKIAREYKTEMILGNPLETGDYRIIPVATASFGTLKHAEKNSSSMDHLSGGSIYPLGLVIISPEGVEFVRVNRPFTSWMVEGILSGSFIDDPSLKKIMLSVLLMIPEKTLGISILPWWVHKVIFALVWFLLALFSTWLFPGFIRETALSMRRHVLRTAFAGIAAFIVIAGLAVLFFLSIAGLPLAFLLLIFYLVLSFAGAVSLALLLGWSLGVMCSRKWPVSTKWAIPGAAIIVILRMIPCLGWVIWICVGLFGLGGALLTLRERVGI